MAVLWEDKKRTSDFSNLRKDLLDTLKENHCKDMIDVARGKLRINKDDVSCDYYDFLKGKIYALKSYHGEYMKQYSWAEITNASLY